MLRRGRNRNNFVIYPAYLDSEYSRKDGRRLSKSETISQPTLLELRLAAEKIGWNFEENKEGVYPKEHWKKRGLIRIEKPEDLNKTMVLKHLSREIKTYIRPRLELKRQQIQESKIHKKKVYTGGKQPKRTGAQSKKQKPSQQVKKKRTTRRR
ncbi:MAG: signal recognition particle subunit SRP19/SEC65 family protein [Promethearchaeota archaeon]